MSHINQTALVTGANAGLGFEAAAQLAEVGYRRVILACRTIGKATAARKQLVERTGRDVFDVIAVDVAELASAEAAAQELIARDETIDLLVLNAGLARTELVTTTDGIELTLAASLFGHHVLTMRLLEANRLASNAHIVIAGSEGARGEMPGMGNYDYTAYEKSFGSLDDAMDATAKGEQLDSYQQMRVYANAKVWVTWWAAALSRELPEGMVAVAVSPGSAPGTSFDRNMPAIFRWTLLPFIKVVGPWIGMAGSIEQGAKRYVDAGDFATDATGKFWASPPGKAVGPLEVQPHSHFHDRRLQDAAWRSVVRLSGVGLPQAVAAAK